jgi:amidase
MKRREFLQTSTLGGALALGQTSSILAGPLKDSDTWRPPESFELDELTISDLQQCLTSVKYTSKSLVRKYLQRIEDVDRSGPAINSVIEVNAEA